MFNRYFIHPKTAFKNKQNVCSIFFLIAFFILVSSRADDLKVEIIKDAVCIAIILIAAVIGKLDNIKEDHKDEM